MAEKVVLYLPPIYENKTSINEHHTEGHFSLAVEIFVLIFFFLSSVYAYEFANYLAFILFGLTPKISWLRLLRSLHYLLKSVASCYFHSVDLAAIFSSSEDKFEVSTLWIAKHNSFKLGKFLLGIFFVLWPSSYFCA